ncbi:uncharacterized protein LOC104861406 isoform X2 [Fukomys damarensis]|uniref:uncharacterized protein LOC104861406 isoform X2 n=1 Tax=Fukomys damarensis TaxID=885580 RepID=UPI001455517A|nr:uncharacterized protein LOC104861406 isoform X2 [Fukomys damarensis]
MLRKVKPKAQILSSFHSQISPLWVLSPVPSAYERGRKHLLPQKGWSCRAILCLPHTQVLLPRASDCHFAGQEPLQLGLNEGSWDVEITWLSEWINVITSVPVEERQGHLTSEEEMTRQKQRGRAGTKRGIPQDNPLILQVLCHGFLLLFKPETWVSDWSALLPGRHLTVTLDPRIPLIHSSHNNCNPPSSKASFSCTRKSQCFALPSRALGPVWMVNWSPPSRKLRERQMASVQLSTLSLEPSCLAHRDGFIQNSSLVPSK